MLTSVRGWFNWLHKSDTLPWLCLVEERNRFPAVGWAEDMGTSRASNAALQRQFPHEASTAQAVEPGREGSRAVLLPAGEDLQTPVRLCGAGSTLPLLPVSLHCWCLHFASLPCLQENSRAKHCQCRVMAGRQYLVFLWEAEQTIRFLRMGKCSISGLSILCKSWAT